MCPCTERYADFLLALLNFRKLNEKMRNVKSLKCKECPEKYEISAKYVCEMCFGPLEIEYNWDLISKEVSKNSIQKGPVSMWRYKLLLPVDGDELVDLVTGFTPLIEANNLAKYLGLKKVWIKNDSVNPTFSFKDRVVSVAATKAKELGFSVFACASTGNLAGSVAAHGAKAGFQTLVFIPSDLEKEKIIAASIYNPHVIAIDGNYDDVNRFCVELADSRSWAFVNINLRPFYSEGSKTIGFELAEQLGWRAPDHIVVPVASGSLYTKVWKGLTEFYKIGLIDEPRTRMHIAQALGCSPITQAVNQGKTHPVPVKPNTIAKSIAIGNPADGYYAVKQAKETNGRAESVPEDEIVEGISLLAKTEGIFTETAGGVVVSSLVRLVKKKIISDDEEVVILITGNGLKTPEVVSSLSKPTLIKPTIDSFEKTFPQL
jgi:threonine synthase